MAEQSDHKKETPEETIARLEGLLKSERDKVYNLQEEVHSLKAQQVEMLAKSEAEEEFITNKLLKQVESLTAEKASLEARVVTIQQERAALIIQLEQEEEYLTNTLQKKLMTLSREKIELENQLEQEEEYIVNQLQKKLASLQREKQELQSKLEEERESHETLRRTQAELNRSTLKNQDLQRELLQLRGENFGLTQKIAAEHEKLQVISQAKAKLEQGLELEDERSFNDEMTLRVPGSGGPSIGGRRHRTRSYSSPINDPQNGSRSPARSPSGSSTSSAVTSSSGSSLTSTTTSTSNSNVSSPPSSPRSNSEKSNQMSPTSTATRARRLSQTIPLLPPISSTSRSANSILKQAWMHCSKICTATADETLPLIVEERDLYFVLYDDSLLEVWENELIGQDGSTAMFVINLDTVLKRNSDNITGELHLETKEATYDLRPQSEDIREWNDLLASLDPLAPSTPHVTS